MSGLIQASGGQASAEKITGIQTGVDSLNDTVTGWNNSQSARVSGYTDIVTFNHVNSNGTYAAGDCVGTFSSGQLLRTDAGTALVNDITVYDRAGQAAALTVYFYNVEPESTLVDNSPFSIAADGSALIGKIEISSGDYKTFGGISFAHVINLNFPVKAETGKNIYIAVSTSGTPSYTANALTFKIGVLQD